MLPNPEKKKQPKTLKKFYAFRTKRSKRNHKSKNQTGYFCHHETESGCDKTEK